MPQKKRSKTRIPQQKRSIEKKNKIMDAAMALFSEKGIHNTNSKEIAAKAEVATGTFYSYFPDKKKLLTELVDIYLVRHFEQIWKAPLPEKADNFREIIKNIYKNLLSAYNEAPGFHMETHVLRYSDPEIRTLYDKETKKELEQITRYLEQYKNDLRIKDIEAAAVVIHSAAESLTHKIKFMGTVDEKRLIEEFCEMVDKYLTRD